MHRHRRHKLHCSFNTQTSSCRTPDATHAHTAQRLTLCAAAWHADGAGHSSAAVTQHCDVMPQHTTAILRRFAACCISCTLPLTTNCYALVAPASCLRSGLALEMARQMSANACQTVSCNAVLLLQHKHGWVVAVKLVCGWRNVRNWHHKRSCFFSATGWLFIGHASAGCMLATNQLLHVPRHKHQHKIATASGCAPCCAKCVRTTQESGCAAQHMPAHLDFMHNTSS